MTHDSVDRYNALKRLKTIEDDLKKIKTTNTPDQKNVDNAYNSLIIFFFFFKKKKGNRDQSKKPKFEENTAETSKLRRQESAEELNEQSDTTDMPDLESEESAT